MKKKKNNLFLATLIDFFGAVLFIIFLKISRQISIIIPILTYSYTYVKYKKEFWKAFVISVITLTILIFAFILIIALTPYKIPVYRYILDYIFDVKSSF